MFLFLKFYRFRKEKGRKQEEKRKKRRRKQRKVKVRRLGLAEQLLFFIDTHNF
jgi:hypothetical protein